MNINKMLEKSQKFVFILLVSIIINFLNIMWELVKAFIHLTRTIYFLITYPYQVYSLIKEFYTKLKTRE